MKLKQAFIEAVSAGYGGIWVRSPEHEDAQRTIAETCNHYHWKMMLLDLDKGFRIVGEEEGQMNDTSFIAALKSSLGYAQKLAKIAEGEDDEDFQAILVIRNIHFCLNNTKNIQALQHVVEEGATIGLHILGLSLEGVKVPAELEKYFYPISHDLPNLDELYDLARDIDEDMDLPEKGSKEAEELLANVAGLSRMEAMGAYGISLARHRKIDPTVLAEVKTATMEMGGLLSPKKSAQGFDAIAGCDHVKDFLKAGILSPNKAEGVKLRSAMLVGWPGTGKSWLSECLGFEVNRPTVAVDVGALKGSLVGQTEANTRRALKTLDAMAPCIAFFDEIEKSVTTDAMDSGASSGQLGALLTWMNDHTSDVFCIFTSNDISKLPPEFLRAERMDGIFYFGCPTREAKDQAWKILQRLKEYLHIEACDELSVVIDKDCQRTL